MPKSGEVGKVLAELRQVSNRWGYEDDTISLLDVQAIEMSIGLIEAQAAEIARLREALSDATAHLAGAASAYRLYASRNKFLKPRAISDALFTTRATDIDNAVERARAALQHKPTETHYDLDG